MRNNDTICAVSTPYGVGGIAVVRLSGPDAKRIAETFLKTSKGRAVTLADHKAKLCDFVHEGDLVDELVATYFATPHSYTGEDVVELSCHGSLYVQQALLQCLMDAGARLAEPGEFTLKAFLSGRLNLSQAEAVADLIDSRSRSAHDLAVSQFRGGYAQELETMRKELIDISALLELELDFSDEDLEFVNRDRLLHLVDTLSEKVQRLLDSFRLGNALKQGIPVAIIGRPNAGKSSLLNALLNDDRAIVSSIPGTTRDTIEETMTIDGMLFRFIDTAGLRESDDMLENIGFDRAIKSAKQAQVVLFVRAVDGDSDTIGEDIAFITSKCPMEDKHFFVVHSKCDLPHDLHETGIYVSAKEDAGIEELKQAIVKAVKSDVDRQGDILLANSRHFEALTKVLSALSEVRKGLEVQLTQDLIAIDLRDALYHLGSITGSVSSDEVLSSVFSRFCIGK